MDKKDLIVNLLKEKGELVETEIAFEIRANSRYTKRYLEELEKEKKVQCRQEGNSKFWQLKKKTSKKKNDK